MVGRGMEGAPCRAARGGMAIRVWLPAVTAAGLLCGMAWAQAPFGGAGCQGRVHELNYACCSSIGSRCVAGTPQSCDLGCAFRWEQFAEACPAVVQQIQAPLGSFLAQCAATTRRAVVLGPTTVNGSPSGSQRNFRLKAKGGMSYAITVESSGGNAPRNELYVSSPSHKTQLGHNTEDGHSKTLVWICTASADDYFLEVWTMGPGLQSYTLTVKQVGMAEDTVPELVIGGRGAALEVKCHDAPGEVATCYYAYQGDPLVHADGSSFMLRLNAEAGRTYQFVTTADTLQTPATYKSATIFPPRSMGGAQAWQSTQWSTSAWVSRSFNTFVAPTWLRIPVFDVCCRTNFRWERGPGPVVPSAMSRWPRNEDVLLLVRMAMLLARRGHRLENARKTQIICTRVVLTPAALA